MPGLSTFVAPRLDRGAYQLQRVSAQLVDGPVKPGHDR